MIKTIIMTVLLFANSVQATSVSQTQNIYNRLLKANGMGYAPRLVIGNSNGANASYSGMRITVNKGMLRITNSSEMAFVLGHELAHWRLGHGGSNWPNEYAADQQGTYYATHAGYSCSGKNVLRKLNSGGDKTHPPSRDRLRRIKC